MINEYIGGHVLKPKDKLPAKKSSYRKRKVPEAELPLLEAFQLKLVTNFKKFYDTRVLPAATVQADDIFGKTEAEAMGLYLHQIKKKEELRVIIGGEFFEGQLDWLMHRLQLYNDTVREDTSQPKKKPRLSGVQPTNKDIAQENISSQASQPKKRQHWKGDGYPLRKWRRRDSYPT
jgi:hypothetical protein